MSQGWADCLESLAAHLAAQQRAVAEGRPQDVRAYEPPAGLGPVPPGLSTRLRALAQENANLTAAITGATTSCARQLQLLTVMHRQEPNTAAFVDSRA